MNHPIIVGITGASGAIYAVRLLETLLSAGRDVYLTISPSGAAVIEQELGVRLDLDRLQGDTALAEASLRESSPMLQRLLGRPNMPSEIHDLDAGSLDRGRVLYSHHEDLLSPLASGSFWSCRAISPRSRMDLPRAMAASSSASTSWSIAPPFGNTPTAARTLAWESVIPARFAALAISPSGSG